MIHSSNTVVVTKTKADSSIGNKRIVNLINCCGKYNLPLIINNYEDTMKTKASYTCEIIIHNITIFKETNKEYAILCDDDFVPCENFLEELNKTVKLLPANWRSLHLCPGYLWGRKMRDRTKIGHLNPEYNMDGIEYDTSGRFYLNCVSEIYCKKWFWLGGPIAILLNKTSVDSFLNDFQTQYSKQTSNNDVIITQMLTKCDYVCREPMLGYEDEQGGTLF
jgi:hypothetical protein